METRITARLRDQLGTAKNANEMFRIFSRFNALFVRPHIRGAIREYQTQLIQRVKDDIESLHDKFKASLGIILRSHKFAFTVVRKPDLVKQIERPVKKNSCMVLMAVA